jgi:hypothetical protein
VDVTDGGLAACPYCIHCVCAEGVDAELTDAQDREDS